MISQEKVANYYQHLTPSYFSYASGSYGWHYGVWDSGVKSFSESLLQSNKRLVDGLDLNTNTQILDVGSGIGGFAVWVAKNFGCSVTGITLCESHIILSETLAALNQVLPQCKFQMMDMNEMSFEDNRFDLIINQETFCYAIDKKNFLSEVHRVLKPGGYWRSADFAVQELPLTPKENRKLKIVLDGFHIPSLISANTVKQYLVGAGFENVEAHALNARPSAKFIIQKSRLPLFLSRIGLEEKVFPKDPGERKSYRSHFKAGMAYSKGILRGYFANFLYSGQKPLKP